MMMMMTSAKQTTTTTPMLFHTISGQQQQWELRVDIVDLEEPLQSQQQQRLRVSGETHIGGVICQLAEKMASTHASMSRQDWSDYALWWPDKSMWLSKTKQTLDQYGVQADALLHFTRMHKPLRVQLPDLQLVHLPSVDFSLPLFYVVKAVCKELHLRHAEELSFLRLASHAKLIERVAALDIKSNRHHDSDNDGNRDSVSSNSTLNNSSGGSANSTSAANHNVINNSKTIKIFKQNKNNNNSEFQQTNNNSKFVREMSNTLSIDSHTTIDVDYDIQSLAFSPVLQTQDVLSAKSSAKFKNLFDKTRSNNKWLDSSKSLLEQNIKEDDLVQLRFKYYAYFDLNLKHDMVRINQIYEQAKWAILSEEIDCTEQELINFAALQLQIQLQTKSLNFGSDTIDYGINKQATTTTPLITQTSVINRTNSLDLDTNGLKSKLLKSSTKIIDEEDDLDTALNKLEKSLDIDETNRTTTTNKSSIELTSTTQQKPQVQEEKPTQQQQQQQESSSSSSNGNEQLAEYLMLIKPHKYTTFKKLKQYYFTLSDLHYLSYYKSREDSSGRPVDKINLKSCELLPDVSLSSRKFGITIRIPSSDGMSDVCLRCPDECSYARWMSALKLASKMRPISDPAFAIEVKSILNLLNMQVGATINKASKAMALGSNTGLSTTDGTNLKSSIKSSLSASFQSIVATSNESAQVQATNLLPLRVLKKHKLKQLNDRILEAYSTISDLDIFESKLRYIKNWQALPNYGISYFAVKIKGSKFREELIGIASNRLLRVSPEGETLKSWRFNTMKSWNVNWDINQFEITFDDDELVFLCLNCDARILHEFIGGYIYLSLRPKLDNNNLSSNLNEEMFFKLTEKR